MRKESIIEEFINKSNNTKHSSEDEFIRGNFVLSSSRIIANEFGIFKTKPSIIKSFKIGKLIDSVKYDLTEKEFDDLMKIINNK
jgi:hypothetical protein